MHHHQHVWAPGEDRGEGPEVRTEALAGHEAVSAEDPAHLRVAAEETLALGFRSQLALTEIERPFGRDGPELPGIDAVIDDWRPLACHRRDLLGPELGHGDRVDDPPQARPRWRQVDSLDRHIVVGRQGSEGGSRLGIAKHHAADVDEITEHDRRFWAPAVLPEIAADQLKDALGCQGHRVESVLDRRAGIDERGCHPEGPRGERLYQVVAEIVLRDEADVVAGVEQRPAEVLGHRPEARPGKIAPELDATHAATGFRLIAHSHRARIDSASASKSTTSRKRAAIASHIRPCRSGSDRSPRRKSIVSACEW